jgi:hypothetical protein
MNLDMENNSRLKLKQENEDNNQLNESITKSSSKLSCNKSSTGISSSSSSPSSTTSSASSSSSSTSTTFNQRLIDSQSDYSTSTYTPNQYFNANNTTYYHHAFNNLQENHYNLQTANQYQENMAYQNVFTNSNTNQIPTATTTNASNTANYQQNIPSSSSSSCSSSSSASSSSSTSSGAFLKYTRPSPTKPENVCCWIDPDTKKMCNKVFYRMDEIGMLFLIFQICKLFLFVFI